MHVTRWLTTMMLVSLTCFGQDTTTEQTPTDAPAVVVEDQQPQPTPVAELEILAAELPTRSRELKALLREVAAGLAPDEKVVEARDQSSVMAERVFSLGEQTHAQIQHEGGLAALEDTEQQWARLAGRLDTWLENLSQRVTWLDSMRTRLSEEKELWERTLESEQYELPEAVRESCANAVADVSDAEKRLLEQRAAALTLQNEVSTQRSEVNVILIDVRAAISERRRSVFEISSPPLWNIASQAGRSALVVAHVRETAEKFVQDIRAYAREERQVVAVHAATIFFLLFLVVALRRPTEEAAEEDGSLQTIAQLVRRPLASALLISTVLNFWLYTRAPTAVDALLTVLLVLAVLRLLPLVLPKGMRRGTSLLVGFFLLHELIRFVPDGTAIYRLILLSLNGLVLWSMHWFLGRFSDTAAGGNRWNGVIRFVARLLQAVLVVALFANVIGSVMLSKLLTVGVLGAIVSAVLCWLSTMILEGLVAVVLRAHVASRLLTVRLHRARILSTTRTFLRAVACVTWVAITLDGFEIMDWAVAVIGGVFELKLGYGDLVLELRDVVLFALTIWASFKISAFLRFVLDEDVVPRVNLPRGVPAALSKGLHYVVLLIGLAVAVAAAGTRVLSLR